MRRTRLRSRVFSITAAYAVLLVGVAFALTWRGQKSQREFNHLLDVDSRAILQLEEISRSHNGFVSQWLTTAEKNPEQLTEFAPRYRAVRQLMSVAPLAGMRFPGVERALTEFEATLRVPDVTAEEIRRHGREVSQAIDEEVTGLKTGIDNKIRTLAADARNTMWVALGIAYIVAILSFALARLTLLKLVQPLETLSRVTERFAAEDFTVRAPVKGDFEIAQLAQSFNDMAQQLAASHDELKERARTDELTGLPNFRAFREIMAGEIERARRYRHSFGVLVVDIDHFKRYNDQFGHLAGNDALKIVAETVRKTLRSVDHAARYGGEEFVAVLPEIDVQGLAVLAERVRLRVAALPPLQESRRITVSVGGALFPGDGMTAETLFEVADERLYEAKSSGRNRVVVPGTPSATTKSRKEAP